MAPTKNDRPAALNSRYYETITMQWQSLKPFHAMHIIGRALAVPDPVAI